MCLFKEKRHNNINKLSFIDKTVCLLLVIMCAVTNAEAINIGDLMPMAKHKARVDITQLDNANDIYITVDVSGIPVNYQAEQINNDLVRLIIDDEQLSGEVFVEITVKSNVGASNRLIVFEENKITENELISTTQQAQAFRMREEQKSTPMVIIPPNVDGELGATIIDNVLNIDITGWSNSVGYAVTELAKAKGMTVLMLPGDEVIHSYPLISSVSSFDDLFLASDQKVKHVIVDEINNWVRVIGYDVSFSQKGPMELPLRQGQVSLRSTMTALAGTLGYQSIIMPGDEVLLDKIIDSDSATTMEGLAMIVGELGGVLDVEDTQKLLRVRLK